MMLRREETLDRSIDRKVKILLSLRKRSPAPPASTSDRGDNGETEDVERIPPVRIASQARATKRASEACPPISEIAEPGSDSAVALQRKIDERSANITVNKGSPWLAGAANCQVKKCHSLANSCATMLMGQGKTSRSVHVSAPAGRFY